MYLVPGSISYRDLAVLLVVVILLPRTFECYMITYNDTIHAPHAFNYSFGRAAKSKVWPIRHWGGGVNSNPY